MLIAARPITGGLALPNEKHRTELKAVRVASVPEQLLLTLDQHAVGPLSHCVRPGDRVLLGQVIAQPQDGYGVPLHAPVSGKVLAIEKVSGSNTQATLGILLASDGHDERHPGLAGIPDYTGVAPSVLREKIAAGGIVGLGGAVFPTHVKIDSATAVHHLLLNGVECEPYISCDDALMQSRAADVVLGGQILLHVLGAARCTIAIEADKPAAISAIRGAVAAAGDSRVDVAVVPTVYPAGGERQLITSLTGDEVPTGGLPRDIGVLCQNVGTAAAVAVLVRAGEPCISRVVTVTGGGVREPCNLEARLGTRVAHLIAECGGYTDDVVRLIAGGSMMGTALPGDDFPVVKATNCIIAATVKDLNPHGEEMPCIRCGKCSQVCPASLLPQELHRFARMQDEAMQERYGMLDCIECGCCDHVCPSRIPLTATFVAARRVLKETQRQRVQSERWRARFQAHSSRLAGEEAERQRRLKEKRDTLRRDEPG